MCVMTVQGGAVEKEPHMSRGRMKTCYFLFSVSDPLGCAEECIYTCNVCMKPIKMQKLSPRSYSASEVTA